MFNKDYIVMLVRTAFQFIGLAASLRPDLFQGVDLGALSDQIVQIVGNVFFIVSTAHMLYARFSTKVVDAK
jgi:hypothetical protein